MPVEIDAIWRLVDPAFAIPVALLVIVVPAFAANRTLRNRSGIDREVYARKMAMAAELLVSISIIGLITLTARIKIESDIRQTGIVAAEHRNRVSLEAGEFVRVYCMGRDKSGVTRDSMAINYACHLWSQVLSSPDAEIDWETARFYLVELAGLSRLSPNLVASLKRCAVVIDQFVAAKRELKIGQDRKGIVESEISWWLVAICAMFAAIGIALKWARAAAELTEAKSKRLSPPVVEAPVVGVTYTYTYQSHFTTPLPIAAAFQFNQQTGFSSSGGRFRYQQLMAY